MEPQAAYLLLHILRITSYATQQRCENHDDTDHSYQLFDPVNAIPNKRPNAAAMQKQTSAFPLF
jgi:hypothetical protein